MKRALVSIRSPFQLLCSVEYVLQNNLDDVSLIIRHNSHDQVSIRQIYKMISTFGFLFQKIGDWGEKPNESARAILSDFKKTKSFVIIWCQPSDERNKKILRITKPRQVVHVDDGTATIGLSQRGNNFVLPTIGRIEKLISGASLRSVRLDKFDSEVFTIFGIESKNSYRVVGHSLSSVKYLLREQVSDSVDSCNAWIIGSPLSETGNISSDQEVVALLMAKKFFESGEKNVAYIPHRYDSVEKIVSLERSGFYIKWPEDCIEITALGLAKPPSDFATISSTALITLSKLFRERNFYRIDFDDLDKKFLETVDVRYSNFSFLSMKHASMYETFEQSGLR